MVTKIADEEEILSDPLSDSRMFTIYPNPTTGVFTMQYKSEIFTGSIQVEMFDMRGNRFLSDSYPAERSHTFTLSDLPAGLYFIKVIKGDLVESLKLIITR
jgi:hypothetical protein